MLKIFKKITARKSWFFCFAFLGLLLRAYLTRFGNFGDIAVFAELGEKFWKVDLREFYFRRDYFYTHPAYFPIAYYVMGVSFWFYDKRYILAEIHNFLKIIPSDFIIYFSKPVEKDPLLYNYGYYFLLKLPAILADLGIAILIFKLIFKNTKDFGKSVLGFFLYFFNHLTIFLSSIWGQNDSVVVFWSLLSFYLFLIGRISTSIFIFFLSIYTKPNCVIFLPIYLLILYKKKIKFKSLLWGLSISTLVFLVVTYPFSGTNFIGFTRKVIFENIIPSSEGTVKMSISGFNFYSIFFVIDKTLASSEIGLFEYDYLSILFLAAINLYVILVHLKKFDFRNVCISFFLVGMGNFLFNINMLERYFFPAFPFMVLLLVLDKKALRYIGFINIILLLNLIWAFYRRSVGVIDYLFSDYNFFLIRLFSFLNVILFIFYLKEISNRFSFGIFFRLRKMLQS